MKSATAKKTAKNSRRLKPFPKTAFKNPAKPLIFMRRIRSSQLIKPFPEARGAGFRAGKLTAVADKNLTRDECV
jgi:hypothetical protein